MITQYKYKPGLFFGLTFLITWVCWFGAAYLSHRPGMEMTAGGLLGLGLLGPLAACLIMMAISGSRELRRDFRNKLFKITLIKPVYLPMIFLFMPAAIALSIVLSTLFGQSLEQLLFASEISIVDGCPLLSLLIPFLAPALEELGWSGYGIDSLKSRHKHFATALIFGLAWSLWHLPLFFVHGYYHYNILNESPVYALNFFISVIPMTILTNWLYFKNNRSIIAAIIFHVVVVMSSEIFMVTNQTKCMVTIVISLFAAWVIMRDRQFFFGDQSMISSGNKEFEKLPALKTAIDTGLN